MSGTTGELPAGWTEVKLADVCAPVAKVDPKTVPDEAFDYVDISSIDRGRKTVSAPKRLLGAEAPSRARQSVSPGDVLLSTVRPNLQGVAPVPTGFLNPVASTGFCVLRPTPRVLSAYLFHAVLGDSFQTRLLAKARGASYPAVRDRDVLGETIALPPVAEQERIVRALERHMSRIEDGVQSFAAASAELQNFRLAVLDRELAGCVGPVGSPLPQLPETWERSTVAEEGVVQLGRMLNKERSHGPNMAPYLRVANVLDDRLDLSDVKEMDFPPQEYERYLLQKGDILLNEGQSPELLGRAAMYRGELPGLCFQKTLLRFQAGSRVDSEFALLVFRYYLYSGRFRRESRISIGIGHLTAERFMVMEFPVPPLDEQRSIAQRARLQLDEADRMEATIERVASAAQALRVAVIRDAVTGKLSESGPRGTSASSTSVAVGRANGQANKARAAVVGS